MDLREMEIFYPFQSWSRSWKEMVDSIQGADQSACQLVSQVYLAAGWLHSGAWESVDINLYDFQ